MRLLEFLQNIMVRQKPVMLYGAGSNARAGMDTIRESFHILGIWDKSLCGSEICGYRIWEPFSMQSSLRPEMVLITIKDEGIRGEILKTLHESGYGQVFFSDDILRILDETRKLKEKRADVSVDMDFWHCGMAGIYEYIDNALPPVNLSIVEKDGKYRDCIKGIEKKEDAIFEALYSRLILDIDAAKQTIHKFAAELDEGKTNFFGVYEVFLRELLYDGVKTRYRPIRMLHDTPYDGFAVAEAQKIIIQVLCDGDTGESLRLTDELIQRAYTDRYLRVLRGFFLLDLGAYEDALRDLRELVKDYPIDFLVNEAFYQAAIRCRENGVDVDEPLPDIDLTKRFCWSGITFAWIGGFEGDGVPIIAPCFRAIECAARPRGDFRWSSEWKLFRESLLDGSFRYCQKNQCTNLVGAWLPEKERCEHPVIRHVLQTSSLEVPSPEELHLSYDKHCNLSCPSCRTSVCTYGRKETDRLDALFDREIKPLIRSARHLCLSGSGEALLSSHSKRILMNLPSFANPNLKVELRTNLTVLNSFTWEKLGDGRRYIRHIAASIDSCSKRLFERLRYPAKWETVVNNLEFVRELRYAGEIDLFEFHVVVQTANIHELLGIAEMAAQYDADAVTYSKIVNWRGMGRKQYEEANPFYTDHPDHERLLREIEKLKAFRKKIRNDPGYKEKPMYINIHFEKDPDAAYDPIRYGLLKIR